jgi:hypothetical protein
MQSIPNLHLVIFVPWLILTIRQDTPLEIIRRHVDHVGSPGEFPTAEELFQPEATPEAIPTFDVDAPHTSKQDLLDRQYKILRAEATEGLRFSVNAFKLDPLMRGDKYTCVYTSVS